MGCLILAVVTGFGLFLGSVVGPVALGLAGAPGALLAGRKRGARWVAGLIICTLAQSYVALIWTGYVALAVRSGMKGAGWLGFVVWILGVAVANAPAWVAIGETYRGLREDRQEVVTNAQHTAVSLTCGLNLLGYIAFTISPSAIPWILPWVHR